MNELKDHWRYETSEENGQIIQKKKVTRKSKLANWYVTLPTEYNFKSLPNSLCFLLCTDYNANSLFAVPFQLKIKALFGLLL